MQAEAEAADLAERQRLQQLAEEVKQFNALKLMELNEKERQERWAAICTCMHRQRIQRWWAVSRAAIGSSLVRTHSVSVPGKVDNLNPY